MLAFITKALIIMFIISFFTTVIGIVTKEEKISITTGLLTLFIVSILVAIYGHGKGRFVSLVLIGAPTLTVILTTVIEIRKERIKEQEKEREKIRKQRVLNRMRRIQETMDRENKWIEIMEEINKKWEAKMRKMK